MTPSPFQSSAALGDRLAGDRSARDAIKSESDMTNPTPEIEVEKVEEASRDPHTDQCGSQPEADNGATAALAKAGTALKPHNASEPAPYILGNTYLTQAGDLVRFVEIANEGTSYETMADEGGVHRYTRRDFGRVTGSDHGYSDPRNTPPLYDLASHATLEARATAQAETIKSLHRAALIAGDVLLGAANRLSALGKTHHEIDATRNIIAEALAVLTLKGGSGPVEGLDLEDDLTEVIADSLGPDWTPRDAAKAVISALKTMKSGVV